jgi:hypothetical protein
MLLSSMRLSRAEAIRDAERSRVAVLYLVMLVMVISIIISFSAIANARPRVDANGNLSQLLGGRPSGCPHAYCGCGLRKFLGFTDTALNLAWEWARRFPRTSAHAGAVAVRRHHVMLLESHLGGTVWLVRDFNGGRHLSWLHARSIVGFIFVDPVSRHAGL